MPAKPAAPAKPAPKAAAPAAKPKIAAAAASKGKAAAAPAPKGKTAVIAAKGKAGAVAPKAKGKAAAPAPKVQAPPPAVSKGKAAAPIDLTRFTRWPRYVWRQRRVRVLQARLKVPPALNQFTRTLDSDARKELFRFATKYAPESKAQRKMRLKAIAAAKAAATDKGAKGSAAKAAAVPEKKAALRCGLKCVTRLVEHKRAKLVLIASDVNPIELVMFLPALCRKLGVPYAIVKGKAQLGKLVGFKEAAAVCFEKIRPEDSAAFGKIVDSCDTKFAKDEENTHRKWGGLVLGRKSQDKVRLQRAATKKAEEAMRIAKSKAI